jgi:hypothetical protein
MRKKKRKNEDVTYYERNVTKFENLIIKRMSESVTCPFRCHHLRKKNRGENININNNRKEKEKEKREWNKDANE